MRKISRLSTLIVALSILLYSFTGHAQSQKEVLEHVISNVLTDDDLESHRLGAKLLYNGNIKGEKLHDLVAYHIVTGISDLNEANVDTYAWLIKALGVSENGRYLDVLQSRKKQYTSNRNRLHKKIFKYMHISLKKLKGRNAENSFNIDLYDFEAIKNKILNSNASTEFKADHLDKIKISQKLEDLYRILGPATSVSASTAKTNTYPSIMRNRALNTQQIRLDYRGAGFIQVGRINDAYQVINIYAYRSVDIPIENIAAHEIASRLLSDITHDVRSAAHDAIRGQIFDPPLLNAIAYRVWEKKNPEGRYNTDAIKLLCQILVASGDPRFRSFLESTATETTNNGLRRYINRLLDSFSHADVEQFKITIE